jgi:alpha-amylase
VVALNNAEEAKTAAIPTYVETADFRRIYGDGPSRLRTGGDRRLTVTVPPLAAVVYELEGRIPGAQHAPSMELAAPTPAAASRARMEVRAEVGGGSFYEVTFLARTGHGGWRPIGTDDNAPYRVFHDMSGLRAGTRLEYKAVVLDNRGHTRTSRPRGASVPPPAIAIEAPAAGAKVRGTVEVRAIADPERATHVVAFERSVAGGPWTPIGSDDSSPAYTVFDDISGLNLATGTPIRYRAILTEPDGARVVSAERAVEQAPPPVTTAIVHYWRPAGDYADWGLHLWGDAIVTGTDWGAPLQRAGVDAGWARYEIALKDDTKPVNFIMHRPSGDSVPDTREPGGDRSFVPATNPEIWLVQGDPAVHTTKPATG